MKITINLLILFGIVGILSISVYGIGSNESGNYYESDWCTPTAAKKYSGGISAISIDGIVEFKGKQMCHVSSILVDDNGGITRYDWYFTQNDEEVCRIVTYPDGTVEESACEKSTTENDAASADECIKKLETIGEEKLEVCMGSETILLTEDGVKNFAPDAAETNDVLERIGNSAITNMEKHYNNREYDRAETCMGIATEIKTLRDVSLFPGYVTSKNIRNFIKDEYRMNGIGYVLIGGDDDVIPAQELWVQTWNNGDTTFMPSDLYYAC